jgi:TolB-like protein/DNA-binding SARP family transcriptional activator/predicted Zn-dependent protease
MTSVHLTLLGGFKASSACGRQLSLQRRKAILLLAFLALRPGEPQTRERLIGLLWSDRGDTQARGSLRQALTALRKTFSGMTPSPLVTSGETLWLDPLAVHSDVVRFEMLARSDKTADLEQAAGLYVGPLLDGLVVRDAEGEQWLSGERERLRDVLLGVLEKLLARQMQDGALDSAVATAERTLLQDPLREEAHRALMRLHVRNGRHNLALRQYRQCAELLSRELGVVPEPETRQLHEEIQRLRSRTECPPSRLGGAAVAGSPNAPIALETANGVAPEMPDAASVAAAQRPAIAVLPFTNIGGDADQDYFADGLTEDIITDLSQISGLFVVARHTVFTFKGWPMRVQDVARDLGVGYVLEGSVRKAGGRVRITAQLVDGQTGGHVWAHRFDRSLDDVIALQEEISKSIVDVLKVKLLPGELEHIGHRTTTSIAAYEYYLLGRSFYLRGIDRRSLTIARALFVKAIDLDPNYARAYAGAAVCESYLTMSDASASFESTLAKISRALELDPTLAEAYAVRGMVLFAAGRYDEAAVEFESALQLGPELFEAHFFYARSCRLQGRQEQAARLFERAAELRPKDFRSIGLLAEQYKTLGRREAFLSAARRCLERLAAELAEHPDNADAWAFGSAILAQLGQAQRAEDWVTRALVIGPDDYMVHYNAARTYALLGKTDAALDHLESAFAALPEFRRRLWAWMKFDEEIASLREHQRYQVLVERLRGGRSDPVMAESRPRIVAPAGGTGRIFDEPPPGEGVLCSAGADDWYRDGRALYLRGIHKHNLRAARERLVRASEIDPGHARAYAGIAICDFYLAMSDPEGSFDNVFANATRALQLEPDLAEAHAAHGLALYAVGNYAEAGAAFEQALSSDPESFEAHFFHARNCRLQGRHRQAADLFARASELRPGDFRSLGLLAAAYKVLGCHDESVTAARRSVQRGEAEIARHPDNADALAFGSGLLGELGERERAEDWATRALAIAADDYLVQYNVARTYALLGRCEEALPRLQRAFSTSPACRQRLAEWMRQDERIAPLRGDSRFRAFAERLASEAAAQA